MSTSPVFASSRVSASTAYDVETVVRRRSSSPQQGQQALPSWTFNSTWHRGQAPSTTIVMARSASRWKDSFSWPSLCRYRSLQVLAPPYSGRGGRSIHRVPPQQTSGPMVEGSSQVADSRDTQGFA